MTKQYLSSLLFIWLPLISLMAKDKGKRECLPINTTTMVEGDKKMVRSEKDKQARVTKVQKSGFITKIGQHKKKLISCLVLIGACCCLGVYYYSDYEKEKRLEDSIKKIYEEYAGKKLTREAYEGLIDEKTSRAEVGCDRLSDESFRRYEGYLIENKDGLELTDWVNNRFPLN